MMRRFFSYLTLSDDFDEWYWDKNGNRIAPWYLAQKRLDDLFSDTADTVDALAKYARMLFEVPDGQC